MAGKKKSTKKVKETQTETEVIESEPIISDTECIVEYWDMSERPWQIAYRGFDQGKAQAKYDAYKKTFQHVRKNF